MNDKQNNPTPGMWVQYDKSFLVRNNGKAENCRLVPTMEFFTEAQITELVCRRESTRHRTRQNRFKRIAKERSKDAEEIRLHMKPVNS